MRKAASDSWRRGLLVADGLGQQFRGAGSWHGPFQQAVDHGTHLGVGVSLQVDGAEWAVAHASPHQAVAVGSTYEGPGHGGRPA